MNKELTLKRRETSFTNKEGNKVSYFQYYVIVNGIEITVKTADNTAKQLLDSYYVNVLEK